jgi:hypothetical protein
MARTSTRGLTASCVRLGSLGPRAARPALERVRSTVHGTISGNALASQFGFGLHQEI